jgi:hypothetical protein
MMARVFREDDICSISKAIYTVGRPFPSSMPWTNSAVLHIIFDLVEALTPLELCKWRLDSHNVVIGLRQRHNSAEEVDQGLARN